MLLHHLAAVVDSTDTHARGEDERAAGCGSGPAVKSGLDLRREGCITGLEVNLICEDLNIECMLPCYALLLFTRNPIRLIYPPLPPRHTVIFSPVYLCGVVSAAGGGGR